MTPEKAVTLSEVACYRPTRLFLRQSSVVLSYQEEMFMRQSTERHMFWLETCSISQMQHIPHRPPL